MSKDWNKMVKAYDELRIKNKKLEAQLEVVLDENSLLKGQLETLPVLTSASDSWMKRATTAEKQLEAVRDAATRHPYRGLIKIMDEAAIGDGCNHHYVATEFDPIPQCEHCGALIGEDES